MSILSADRVFMCDFPQRDRTPGSNQYYTRKSPGELAVHRGQQEKSKVFLDMNIVTLLSKNSNPKSVRSRGGVSCR